MPTNKFSTKNKSTKKIPDWILRLEKEEKKDLLSHDIVDIIMEIPIEYRFTSELIRKRILEIHDPPIYKCKSTNVRDVLRRLSVKGMIDIDEKKLIQYGHSYVQYFRNGGKK